MVGRRKKGHKKMKNILYSPNAWDQFTCINKQISSYEKINKILFILNYIKPTIPVGPARVPVFCAISWMNNVSDFPTFYCRLFFCYRERDPDPHQWEGGHHSHHCLHPGGGPEGWAHRWEAQVLYLLIVRSSGTLPTHPGCGSGSARIRIHFLSWIWIRIQNTDPEPRGNF